jgi:hypothetical protein
MPIQQVLDKVEEAKPHISAAARILAPLLRMCPCAQPNNSPS